MQQTSQILAGAMLIWLGMSLYGAAYDVLTATATTEQPINPPNINSIREMSELTVLEIEATEIVSTSFRGYTGGTSIVMLVNGTLTYGVDLDQARYLQTDPEERHLLLVLPQPRARQVATNPGRCRVLNCERKGLWQLAIGEAREDDALMSAMANGHDRITVAASREDLISRARRHAEAVLVRFVSELGWTLEVRWDE